MRELYRLFALAMLILVLGLGCNTVSAQDRPPDFANLDPQQIKQQMEQRIMDNLRAQLEVTNDSDWNAMEPLVTKVVQDEMGSIANGLGELRDLLGNGSDDSFNRSLPDLGPPDTDAEILQNTIDANAPTAQIRAALASYRESRRRKAAELNRDQEQLRQVLSVRQEAALVLMGILN